MFFFSFSNTIGGIYSQPNLVGLNCTEPSNGVITIWFRNFTLQHLISNNPIGMFRFIFKDLKYDFLSCVFPLSLSCRLSLSLSSLSLFLDVNKVPFYPILSQGPTLPPVISGKQCSIQLL